MDINFLKTRDGVDPCVPLIIPFQPNEKFSLHYFKLFIFVPFFLSFYFHFLPHEFLHTYINIFGFAARKVTFPKA